MVQHEILENVRKLQAELGFAVLFISHDIGTVLDLSDRILVMYAGEIVEEQPSDLVLHDPMHPYTKGLMGSYGDPRDETVHVTYVPGTSAGPVAPAGRLPVRSAVPGEDRTGARRVDPPLDPLAGGRVACHVARIQRSDTEERSDEVGPIIKTFAGPQFVKSAEDAVKLASEQAVLTLSGVSEDLPSAPRAEDGRHPGGDRCRLRAAPWRGDCSGRAERQREVHPGADDHRRRDADHRDHYVPPQ